MMEESIPDISKIEPTYFQLQAYWGSTKHMGGKRTTSELAELCQIGKDSYVLDVGCGVGATPCYLTKKHGARVVGVDVSRMMIRRAQERMEREGVKDRVELRVADAQDLPFGNELFDVVICESVLTFIKDKKKALGEFVRVLKQNGYVGLNEEIWLKMPSEELVDYSNRIWDIEADILTSENWHALLKDAGLQVILVKRCRYGFTYKDYIGELSRYGLRDYLGMICRFFALYFRNPKFRKYLKGRYTSLPKGLFDYLGYGIFVGRK
jgi:ubiquinone/menaquinone biosynthesis C-methylase UbiE